MVAPLGTPFPAVGEKMSLFFLACVCRRERDQALWSAIPRVLATPVTPARRGGAPHAGMTSFVDRAKRPLAQVVVDFPKISEFLNRLLANVLRQEGRFLRPYVSAFGLDRQLRQRIDSAVKYDIIVMLEGNRYR